MSLNITDSHHVREDHQRENLDENLVPVAAAEGRPRLNQHNHFFHFDGELSTFDIRCCCPNKQGEQPSVEGNSVCASAETQTMLCLCLSNTFVFLMVLLQELRCVSEVSQSCGDFLKDFVQVLPFLDLLWSAASVTGIYSLCAMLTSRMGNYCGFFCYHVVVNQ